MNVLTAIKGSVAYPLNDVQVEVIAVRRGLNTNATYTTDMAKSESFELTYADCLKLLVTQPNISEGGVSISISDRKSLIAIANGIYKRYDEPVISEANPEVYPMSD